VAVHGGGLRQREGGCHGVGTTASIVV
jgi:hypothetical protein